MIIYSLPDSLDDKQKKNKIKNLLQKLRTSGFIEPIGYDWILSKPKEV